MPPARTKTSYTQKSLPFTSKSGSESKPRAPDPPKKVDSDIILSIKPEFAELIRAGKKNHEYRKYQLRDTVKRLWLYESAPVLAITCVMETSRGKVPGEVNDPSGIGNDDFDAGLKKSKYGYPVLGVWSLKEPIKAAEMKSKFGIAPPQMFVYLTSKMMEDRPLEDMVR